MNNISHQTEKRGRGRPRKNALRHQASTGIVHAPQVASRNDSKASAQHVEHIEAASKELVDVVSDKADATPEVVVTSLAMPTEKVDTKDDMSVNIKVSSNKPPVAQPPAPAVTQISAPVVAEISAPVVAEISAPPVLLEQELPAVERDLGFHLSERNEGLQGDPASRVGLDQAMTMQEEAVEKADLTPVQSITKSPAAPMGDAVRASESECVEMRSKSQPAIDQVPRPFANEPDSPRGRDQQRITKVVTPSQACTRAASFPVNAYLHDFRAAKPEIMRTAMPMMMIWHIAQLRSIAINLWMLPIIASTSAFKEFSASIR